MWVFKYFEELNTSRVYYNTYAFTEKTLHRHTKEETIVILMLRLFGILRLNC